MAEYDPELTVTNWPQEQTFGGLLVSREAINSEQISSVDLSEVDAKPKESVYKQGEVLLVEGTLQSGDQIANLYIVVDAGRQRRNTYKKQKQFRVLEEITGDHRLVAHNSGERYQIPVDTQYPCTHIDVPEDQLIPFKRTHGGRKREYTEKQPLTEWLARVFNAEEAVLTHHI